MEVALDGRNRSSVSRTHGEAPLLVRQGVDGAGGLVLWLVNGAAGPLGGDDLTFRLVVHDGAQVAVRAVAAVLAHPGPVGGGSTQTTHLHVGAGSRLDWAPEATISIMGSDHRSTVLVDAADDATARIVETVVLGRHHEGGGRLTLRQRVERAGIPLLDHTTELAEGPWTGPGGNGAGRALRSTLVLGSDAATAPSTEIDREFVAGTFPLAPRCALTVERAHDLRPSWSVSRTHEYTHLAHGLA